MACAPFDRMFRAGIYAVILVWIAAAPRGWAVDAPAASPEAVLKEKGLVRVGNQFLLPADASLAEPLRDLRVAKVKADAAAAKRAALEQEIKQAAAISEKNLRDSAYALQRASKTDK